MSLTVSIELVGVAALEGRLARLSDQVAGDKLATAARAGALLVETRWKALFAAAGSPSVAGQPPRVRTGTYRRSIHTEIIEQSRSRAIAAVGSGITTPPYPEYLEFGTSRMPAHPIARPAFSQTRAAAEAEMGHVLRGLLGLP
jgi:HK97 gp10 family phage protein